MTDIRRIVIGQLPNGEIKRISDGIAEDIITDNARPGYKSTKIWATFDFSNECGFIRLNKHFWFF